MELSYFSYIRVRNEYETFSSQVRSEIVGFPLPVLWVIFARWLPLDVDTVVVLRGHITPVCHPATSWMTLLQIVADIWGIDTGSRLDLCQVKTSNSYRDHVFSGVCSRADSVALLKSGGNPR